MTKTLRINGGDLNPTSDFASIIRKQLLTWSGLTDKHDMGPDAGIRRLFEEARGTDLEVPLTNAVMKLLTDRDVELRTGVIRILKQYPECFDPRELIKALDGHLDLFRDVKPTRGNDPDLEWGILRAVAGHPGHDPAVLDRLRRAALDRQRGAMVLGGLTTSDAAWVISNAREVVLGDPLRAAAVLVNLPSAKDREEFVRAAGSSRESQEAVATAISDHVDDRVERDHLSEVLRLARGLP